MKLTRINLRVIAQVIFGLVIAVNPFITAAPSAAAVRTVVVSPSSQAVANGASFSVNLVITTDVATRGWQSQLDFDAAKLICNGITAGNFYQDYIAANGGSILPFPVGVIDNVNGHISDFGYAIVGGGSSGPTGTGVLCTLNFTAKPDVNAIAGITPSSVFISDVLGAAIPGVSVAGGQVAIGVVIIPTVTVTVNAPANVPPNYNFTVSIDAENATSLAAANYNVTFNPAVLRLNNVRPGLINGTSLPVVAWNQIVNGTYNIAQTFTSVNGSGSLAVLEFRSIGDVGTSANITIAGRLTNGFSQEIPSQWVNDAVAFSVTPGDANGDGIVNATDITKIERIIAQLDAITPGADANLDGKINAIDITKVERIIAGLP